ncbi:MAG: export transporter permease LptF [Pseudomonadota bacterium]
MLFHSSLRQDLVRSFGATLVVLVTIVMTMMLIRTLGQASRGSVNPSEVSLVLGYTVLGHLPTILTMSVFIATVGTLSRMYRDSEMVIWLSSGNGLLSFLGPLLRFSWPLLLLIFLLALVVWPWTHQQTQELKDRFEKRGDLERVAPGQFQESANGQRVFFIEKDVASDKQGKNVFIASQDKDGRTVTTARNGQIKERENDRFLMLSAGQRLDQSKDSDVLKLSEFKEYGTLISSQPLDSLPFSAKATHSWVLVENPSRQNLAELAWRLGLGLAAFNLIIMALAMARINPRGARGGHMLLALFTFIVYYNLINLGQNWIASGRASFGGLMLSLHGGALTISLGLLLVRHHDLRWVWPLRKRGQGRIESAPT